MFFNVENINNEYNTPGESFNVMHSLFKKLLIVSKIFFIENRLYFFGVFLIFDE